MSDAISDGDRESMISETQRNVSHIVSEIKVLRAGFLKYQDLKSKLEKAGYLIKECGERVEVWKQI